MDNNKKLIYKMYTILEEQGNKFSQFLENKEQYIYINDLIISQDGKTLLCCGDDAETVIIPETVTTISERAFIKCLNLKEINIPNTVTTINARAFEGCYNLRKINIPDTVTTIDRRAFFRCEKLVKIIIPEGVITIGASAFEGCSNLIKITIPEGVTTIGAGAFRGCSNLREITIPEGVTTIEKNVFFDCYSLSEINVPNTITTIGAGAFEGCSSLGEITIPEGVTTIMDGAFEGCSNLIKITIPEGITTIGAGAFEGCSSLGEITIPDTVKTIGENAFGIGENTFVFGDCYDLTINYHGLKFKMPKDIEMLNNMDDFYRNMINALQNDEEFFVTFLDKNNNIDESNNEFTFIYTYIYNQVIKLMNKDNNAILEKYLKEFDLEIFKNNIEQLKKCGLSNTNIIHSITQGGIFNLLNVSFDAAVENYQYLLDENIISKEKFEELIFGDADGDFFIEKLFNYYEDYGTFPSLFKALLVSKENQLELRDRLKYISVACLDKEKLNLSEARLMFGKTLFENIAEYDKQNFNTIDREVGERILKNYPQMVGVLESFYKKINGINENWFKDLSKEMVKDNREIFEKFFNSLNTINNWDNISDKQERATRLKNEIIGKLLYASIVYSNNGEFKQIADISEKQPKEIWKIFNYEKLSIKELLEYATKMELETQFDSNGKINDSLAAIGRIKNLLKIDLYAFDMFKSGEEPSELEVIFAAIAKQNGYIFDDGEIKRYQKKLNEMDLGKVIEQFNDIKTEGNKELLTKTSINKIFNNTNNRNITEFISNNIGIPKIPTERKSIFLSHIRMQAKEYTKNHNINELNEFTESLDLYLRANSEYIFQSKDHSQEEISRYIYNPNSPVSDADKMIYSIYNLNKLAHNSSEIHLKSYLDNKYRNPKLKMDKEIEHKLNIAINGYNILNQYGIERNVVNTLLMGKYDYTNSDTILSKDAISTINGYLTDDKELEELDIHDLQPIYHKLQKEAMIKMIENIQNGNANYQKQPYKNLSKIIKNIDEKYPNRVLSKDELYHQIEVEKIKNSLEKIVTKELNKSNDSLSKDVLKIEEILKENQNELLIQLLDVSDNTIENNIETIANKINIDDIKEINLSLDEKNIVDKNLNDILSLEEQILYKKAEEQKSIKKQFEKISRVDDEDKLRLSIYIEEAITFYQCKQIFAEEIMNKLAMNMAEQVGNVMFASPSTKQQFYAENGFIAEIQYDESNNLVLACLSEQFNEAFSVHLQNLDETTKKYFSENITQPTISHVKLLGKGLTLRDETYDDYVNIYSADENFSGFNTSYEMLGQSMKSNYDMYDLPARKLRQEKQEEIEILFLDEDAIKKRM